MADWRSVSAEERQLRITGRVLYLTEDPELIARQLAGEDLPYDPALPLCDNVSTDEIAPGWACYYYDETLARFALVGLRGGVVTPDSVRRGGFSVIVSGRSKGCGSSRETAPYAELCAGVRLIVARSIEKIYGQNAHNIGLLTTTDFSVLERIANGEPLPLADFTRGLDPISRCIVELGGLFAYNEARMSGQVAPPALDTGERPLTLCEKIIASHVVASDARGELGAGAVKPGDAVFVRSDVRFSHEYVTPMADALFRAGFGEDARVNDPQSVLAFRDHLTFLERVMPDEHKLLGLDVQARRLEVVQQAFGARHGIRVFGEVERAGRPAGSEAICHNKIIEDYALPGQIVVGTDSHTCMAGALGCFAFGVGSTDMANAWYTRDVRLKVPESTRIVLLGSLAPGVCAKDVMLFLLALPYFKSGKSIGQVLEFAGPGIAALSLDERATLTNMAVEAGGFTGIIEPDQLVLDYLVEQRGAARDALERLVVRADDGATYAAELRVDLDRIEPMVALPGDPKNGIPLAQLEAHAGGAVRIDIAYGGSCTGGKRADMDMYASVLSAAVSRNLRVAAGVKLYIQFGSRQIRDYAESRGYVQLFERAGAELVDPSCGACIRAGPGVSFSPDEVTVSAINRNFPGRSGPGRVYLASPLVVAASALAGRIAAPETRPAGPAPTSRV
jgi:3-isopropylmalate/(R)-2-methylmalate dehydratase large subunit